MAAGPFPTKVMHEALKSRVDTLEATPSGGGGGGSSAAELFVGLPSMGSPTAPLTPLFNIRLRWVRRTVSVAGFRLAGTLPVDLLAGASLQRGPFGNEAVSTFSGLVLTRVETTVDGQAYTDYLFDRSYVVTDTTLNINFNNPQSYPVSAASEVTLAGVDNPDGSDFPYLAILSDQRVEVPVVPEATLGDYEQINPRLTYSEVVWPASGAPYLHVFRGATEGGAAVHHHVPLTAGLPV